MQLLSLGTDLSESLAEQARREDRTVEDIVSDAVEKYLETQWRARLEEEQAAYVKLHPDLMHTHLGAWVAVHDGVIVDQDLDRVALYHHVRQKYGRTPVLVCEVTEQSIEEIWLRTPSTGKQSS